MKKLILALMLMMAMPTSLDPAYHIVYPVVIMDTGSYRYILEEPGGKITMEEK